MVHKVERKVYDIQNPAVLLIDMQIGFLQRHDPESVRNQKEAQKKVLDSCVHLDIPVAFIEFTEYGPIEEDLLAYEETISRTIRMTKRWNNAFRDTSLANILKEEWKAKSLYLMGVNASYCIKYTAIGAKEKGFKIFTSEDVIADRVGLDSRRKSLWWYKQNGVCLNNYSEFPPLNPPQTLN